MTAKGGESGRGSLRSRLLGRIGEGSRYLVVGGVAWLIDLAVFVALFASVGIVWAQTAARLVGAAVTFVGHKHYAFGDQRYARPVLARQAVSYLILWAASYGLSLLGILWLVSVVQISEVSAKVLVEAVLVVLNYVATRRIILG